MSAALQDDDFTPAHDFLRFFLSEAETMIVKFYQTAQTLGETAFETELAGDFKYWSRTQSRWGQGPGYRDDIADWTSDWFCEEARNEREEFINAEIQKAWQNMLGDLSAQISSNEKARNGESIASPTALQAAPSS